MKRVILALLCCFSWSIYSQNDVNGQAAIKDLYHAVDKLDFETVKTILQKNPELLTQEEAVVRS